MEHGRPKGLELKDGVQKRSQEIVPVRAGDSQTTLSPLVLSRLRAAIQSCRTPCLLEAAATALSAEAMALNSRQQGSLESQAYWGATADRAWAELLQLEAQLRIGGSTPLTKGSPRES